MKKIISGILAVAMLVCILCVPVAASDVSTGIYIGVSFDKETGLVSVSGQMLK